MIIIKNKEQIMDRRSLIYETPCNFFIDSWQKYVTNRNIKNILVIFIVYEENCTIMNFLNT